jgi:hypothetical protein
MKKGDAIWHRLFCFCTYAQTVIAVRREPDYRFAIGT